MNMGIIGCGRHSQNHAQHYGKDFVTLGVWDPDPIAMAKIPCQKKYGSAEELVGDPEIRTVIIGSPDEYHLAQTDLALRAGKHVLCEKPLIMPGQKIEWLEGLFDLAENKGLVLTSCHPRRFDRPFMWMKDQLALLSPESIIPNQLGDVLSFEFDFSYHKPSNKWKEDRSLLLDHLNHEVDLMNFFFDISAMSAWKLSDTYNGYEVAGKRDDGITFHFRGTRRLEAKNFTEWCRIRFERGEIILDMMMGVAHILDHEKKTTLTVPDLAIDHEGRLQRTTHDFWQAIQREHQGYLTRAEMIMNSQVGLILQKDGIQRIEVR